MATELGCGYTHSEMLVKKLAWLALKIGTGIPKRMTHARFAQDPKTQR